MRAIIGTSLDAFYIGGAETLLRGTGGTGALTNGCITAISFIAGRGAPTASDHGKTEHKADGAKQDQRSHLDPSVGWMVAPNTGGCQNVREPGCVESTRVFESTS